ncbi:MAG: hypothetical protein GX654_03690 [Desulfatiglans sp.]|jgi:hypothetical protein|nr:hypothetical protein [Desulfatiglans sp.]
MKNTRLFIGVLLIIGLMVSTSNTFAGGKYNIDEQSIKKIAEDAPNKGKTEIIWKATVKNNADKPVTFDVTVDFVNSENEKVGQASKTRTIPAGESKIVSNRVVLNGADAKEINSGYVVISKVEESADKKGQELSANLGDSIKGKFKKISDNMVEVAYSVKLKNNTDKAMTKDITVAFMDENSRSVGSKTKTTSSFNAGESKVITDTITLTATEANRIATGHVTIND